MRKFVKFAIMFSVLFASLILFSCDMKSSNDDNAHTIEFFAMDTVISIKAYGENTEKALSEAKNEVLRLEELLSVNDENSEIYLLNSTNKLDVSDETAYLISTAIGISEKTNGAFDISIYPLVKLYGFTQSEYRVPDNKEILNALEYVDFRQINIENNNEISVSEGMSLDLGGIAKGYCADAVAECLKKNGVSSAVISLGGNIRLLGEKPDNSNFSIAIRDPNDSSEYIGSVALSDCAVVTSGSYQRYFEENGVKYHHIIDPKTGKCADSGLVSVTVISQDSTIADALSTAFFVMGKEKAELYCIENSDISAILVDESNHISVIGDVDFSLSQDSDYTYSTTK